MPQEAELAADFQAESPPAALNLVPDNLTFQKTQECIVSVLEVWRRGNCTQRRQWIFDGLQRRGDTREGGSSGRLPKKSSSWDGPSKICVIQIAEEGGLAL